jgi:hypothetical protein
MWDSPEYIQGVLAVVPTLHSCQERDIVGDQQDFQADELVAWSISALRSRLLVFRSLLLSRARYAPISGRCYRA